MRSFTDLSGSLENGLWGYHELPGLENRLPRFHLETATTVKEDSFFSSLIGTCPGGRDGGSGTRAAHAGRRGVCER